jgi:hypothetical protein
MTIEVGCKIEIKEKSKPASSSPRTLLLGFLENMKQRMN